MSAASQQRSILHSVNYYSSLLEKLSEEDFQRSPAEGTWSYAEVYSHIFKSNLFSLVAAEQCINGTAAKSSLPTPWAVRLILFFGRFPPGKYKVPPSIVSLTSKINREEARNLIVKFRTRLTDIAPKVNQAKPYHKIKHPRLGLFNAGQWFRFIEIHTLHHQKQLDRISNMVIKSRSNVSTTV
jgi:hypothetical protein